MIFGLNLITVDILDIMGQRILILQEVNLVGLLFRWNLVHVGFLLSLGLPLALIAVLMPVHQLIVTLSNFKNYTMLSFRMFFQLLSMAFKLLPIFFF